MCVCVRSICFITLCWLSISSCFCCRAWADRMESPISCWVFNSSEPGPWSQVTTWETQRGKKYIELSKCLLWKRTWWEVCCCLLEVLKWQCSRATSRGPLGIYVRIKFKCECHIMLYQDFLLLVLYIHVIYINITFTFVFLLYFLNKLEVLGRLVHLALWSRVTEEKKTKHPTERRWNM